MDEMFCDVKADELASALEGARSGGIGVAGKYIITALIYNREGLDFGSAILLLKAGKKVARAGWNGKGMWINLQVPDANSKMSLPYIYMFTADQKQVPWLASQTDCLATDYFIVE